MNYFVKCNISFFWVAFKYEMVYKVREPRAKNAYGAYFKGGPLNLKTFFTLAAILMGPCAISKIGKVAPLPPSQRP